MIIINTCTVLDFIAQKSLSEVFNRKKMHKKGSTDIYLYLFLLKNVTTI